VPCGGAAALGIRSWRRSAAVVTSHRVRRAVRLTKRLLEEDPDWRVLWGCRIKGNDAGDGWFELFAGGYLPMTLDGVRI
jgi:hypothetical protein